MIKENTKENTKEKRATLQEDLDAWAESTGFVLEDDIDDDLENFIL